MENLLNLKNENVTEKSVNKINTSSVKKYKEPIVSVLLCVSQVSKMHSVLTIRYVLGE
jgi:hypothetical protein